MNFSFWSDEDRLFVPRLLGWSINFKYIAKKLGWIKPSPTNAPADGARDDSAASEDASPMTREERLRRAADASRYEDR